MSILFSLAPVHVLTYSFMFGATTFHSFYSAVVAFKVLPRKEFGILQHHLLGPYFIAQSVAPIVIGLTAPYTIPTFGLVSLGISSLGGLINNFYCLPVSRKLKADKEALLESNGNVETEEVKTLAKQFGKVHGISMLINVISIASLTAYGFVLTSGLIKFIPK